MTMVKRLKCRSLGYDCPYEARGFSPEQVVQHMEQHMLEEHHFRPKLTEKIGWYAPIVNVEIKEDPAPSQ